LDELDDNLKVLIDQKIPVELNEKLNQRLKRYSFKSGFINREFFNIESKRKNIPDSRPISMKLKKNRINNFERIISAWK
jgi:ribosomal protein L14E/L6E/L27E